MSLKTYVHVLDIFMSSFIEIGTLEMEFCIQILVFQHCRQLLPPVQYDTRWAMIYHGEGGSFKWRPTMADELKLSINLSGTPT